MTQNNDTSGASLPGETTKPGATTAAPMAGGSAGSGASPASASGGATTHPVIEEHQSDTTRSRKLAIPEGVKQQANKVAADASGKARDAAAEGKAKASETVANLASSTRQAADQFRGTQAEPVVQYLAMAADQADKFSATLNDKSVDELLDDFREMVRRSPAIAIGAAAALGFAASRFLKATEHVRGGGMSADGAPDTGPTGPTT